MPQTATRPRCSTALLMWSLLGIGAVLAGASDLDQLQPRGGDALLGLSREEQTRFEAGKTAYARPFIGIDQSGASVDGLGPIFNAQSCSACHGVQGGSGPTKVTQFGRMVDGTFDDMADQGGPVLQIDALECDDLESIPSGANTISERLTLGSMGYGLIEALTNEQILANENAQAANTSDPISGRVHWTQPLEDPKGDPVAGRFGWKADVPTVTTFSIGAAFNELGLTSPNLPVESFPNGAAGESPCDGFPLEDATLPDLPEHSTGYLAEVIDFQRLMAPPPQAPRQGHPGEVIFQNIGCAICHTPRYTTPDDPNLEPALRGIEIQPYSDFLLHDMPDIEDGIVIGDASGSEIRTPALWGLRQRVSGLMHDGSVFTVAEAIRQHGPTGEARESAAQFIALEEGSPEAAALLLDFLDSLGRPDFDLDGNGVRNESDLELVISCLGAAAPQSDCGTGDLDGDGAVDSTDVSTLYRSTGDFEDCNQNGVADSLDIELGISDDLDGNRTPDECDELPYGVRVIRLQGTGGDIPDGDLANPLVSSVSISGEVNPITEVRLTMTGLDHRWSNELKITLAHEPEQAEQDRGEVNPINFCERGWDLIGTYVFRDDAECSVCDRGTNCGFNGTFFEEGRYRLADSVSGNTFAEQFTGNGRLPNGTWTLTVADFINQGNGGWIGDLDSWTIDIYVTAPPCPADLNGDGAVDGADLTIVLSDWGCAGADCVGDLDGSGEVDGADLTIILSAWGNCG